MTANFMYYFRAGALLLLLCWGPTPSTCRGSLTLAAVPRRTARFVNFNAITLNDRIREQLVGHFGRKRLRLRGLRRRQVELEVLALPHVLNPAIAQRMQRLGDGAPLWIEDRRFQSNEDAGSHWKTLAK